MRGRPGEALRAAGRGRPAQESSSARPSTSSCSRAGQPAVRGGGDRGPVGRRQVLAEQWQEGALLLGGLRVDGVGDGPAAVAKASRAGAVPATCHWRAAVATSRSMWSIRAQRAGPVVQRRPGPRRSGRRHRAQQRRPDGLALDGVVVQQHAADQLGVAGQRERALGLVGGRPGGQVGEQPQLAPDQLVQHALVGDGAAGRPVDAAPVRLSRRRSSAAGRGTGISAGRCGPRSGHGEHLVRRSAAAAGGPAGAMPGG